MPHSFSLYPVLSFSLIVICSSLSGVKSFQFVIQLPQFLQPFGHWLSFNRVSVNDHGAKGDGVTDDTKAFIDAWEVACSFHSRSMLEIPEGKVYLIGPLDFGGPCRSKLTVSVSGTIVAPEDPHFWDGLNPRKWLYFHGVDHLVVKGKGTINGMGMSWWEQSCKLNPDNPCRHAPTALTFHRCNNLKVHDLTILNSQQMHMAFTNCYDVKASRLKVVAPPHSPNTDGIHISSSKHVQVIESEIATGDDCISIVGNTSMVRIKDITCGPGHGISIGSLGKFNSSSLVYDVMVDRAKIFNTENGVRIKTWQGGSGFVRKINFWNVWMSNVSNPIIIDQYYCDSPFPCPNQTLSVKVDTVSFVGISGMSATEEAIRLACSDNFPCERIRLRDIQLFYPDGNATSYCWNAFGSGSGLVYPPPCFFYDKHIIEQKILFRTALHSITT